MQKICVVTVVNSDGEVDYVLAEEFEENQQGESIEMGREAYHALSK